MAVARTRAQAGVLERRPRVRVLSENDWDPTEKHVKVG